MSLIYTSESVPASPEKPAPPVQVRRTISPTARHRATRPHETSKRVRIMTGRHVIFTSPTNPATNNQPNQPNHAQLV